MQSAAVPWHNRASLRILFVLLAALAVATTALGCFNASCKPQDVRGVNMRCGGGARGFMWTGTSCIYTVACNCTGPDCQSLYSTQDACETAHIHCH
jgi:hypothetical protein